jgi:hypothetical protein
MGVPREHTVVQALLHEERGGHGGRLPHESRSCRASDAETLPLDQTPEIAPRRPAARNVLMVFHDRYCWESARALIRSVYVAERTPRPGNASRYA